MRLLIPAVLLLSPFLTFAQNSENLTVLTPNELVEPQKMVHRYLLAEAQKHFDNRRNIIAQLKTPDQIQARQRELREKFIDAIGGFPERTPLRPEVVGKIQCNGYRIEKVIYESRPNHHVTANLYIPDGAGPFPGVLMPIGHSINGKAAEYVQRGSMILVKNGIAVLTYDPIGQGERRQLLNEMGKAAIPGSTAEHTMIGVGAMLIGEGTASYRIWDGIRSLDYLASRPEIDPKRLGCSGCSGGGTMTSYLMALDDRIAVAAPSCYITSLERLFATIGPQDAEQNIPGSVAFEMEHSDFLTMRGPKPTLVLSASRDFFDIQGTWTSFREAKRLYGLLGYGERIDIFESDSTHGYPKSQREAMVRWMRRWLVQKDEPIVEGESVLIKDEELLCTRTGQVLEDRKGRSAFDITAERAQKLASTRVIEKESFVNDVAKTIGVKLPIAPAAMKEIGVIQRDGYAIQKLVFTTEPGIVVPGLLFATKQKDKLPLMIVLNHRGMSVDAAPGGRLETEMKKGRRVLALDLRGMGETAPGAIPPANKPSPFGNDFKEAFISLHLNRPLLGQRVFDLLSIVSKMGASEIIATGTTGPIALHAGVLEPSVKSLVIEDSIASWESVARAKVTTDQLTNVVVGVLKKYDLPDLIAAMAPRKVEMVRVRMP